MTLDDPARTAAQYAREGNLETRRSAWQPAPDGRDPATLALEAIVAAAPTRVLEVGAGTGVFASRPAAALPDAAVVATDASPRFVDLTAARGLDARLADVQDLPFEDDSFDAVAALWMLYHVPDLTRGFTEIRRVLRPGGLLVAVTNGDAHVAQLRRDAGGAPAVTGFSSENGEPALRRHFGDVQRDELETRAVFPDHTSAMAYLASSQEDVAWDLPWFDGPSTPATSRCSSAADDRRLTSPRGSRGRRRTAGRRGAPAPRSRPSRRH